MKFTLKLHTDFYESPVKLLRMYVVETYNFMFVGLVVPPFHLFSISIMLGANSQLEQRAGMRR